MPCKDCQGDCELTLTFFTANPEFRDGLNCRSCGHQVAHHTEAQQQAAQVTASIATAPRADYLRKRYIISDLQLSPGTLEHGIRDWVLRQMTGRPVSGYVRRAYLEGYGQSLIIVAISTPLQLQLLEDELLSLTPYWGDWTQDSNSDSRPDPGQHTFVIAQSLKGATSGPNSEGIYDNASDARSKQSSHSSRSSGHT